MMVLFFVYVK